MLTFPGDAGIVRLTGLPVTSCWLKKRPAASGSDLPFHRVLGEYAGFDETQPTSESGGKGKVIAHLKEQFHFKNIVMIGDGATDMEACPPAVSITELEL